MQITQLSHRQALVLHAIRDHRLVEAGEVRRVLASNGDLCTGPKFYQAMRRMAESGLLTATLHNVKVTEFSTVPRTFYRLTDHGRETLKELLQLYHRMLENQP